MKRTNKQEQARNAKLFWDAVKDSDGAHSNTEASRYFVVVMEHEAGSPDCRFWGTVSTQTVVIAESHTHGIDGCFMEFIGNVWKGPQRTFYEPRFNDWLQDALGIRIVKIEGPVILFKKEETK